MRDLINLPVHLIATLARLTGPGGLRSVVAESLLVKYQLLILNRSRQRSSNLPASDRMRAGRHCRAAARRFRELLKGEGRAPHRLITDKLRSYTGIVKLRLTALSDARDGRHLLRAVHHRLSRTRAFRVGVR